MEVVNVPESSPQFSDIARKVIRNSIRSAICIDDRYASPYEEEANKFIDDEPRKLYRSFREEGQCDLDIYRFQTLQKSWNPSVMLSNKDLLILDWELDTGGRFDSTLKILNDVIDSAKIPFVVIYTTTQELSSISKELIREFSPVDSQGFESTAEELKYHFSKISETKEIDDVDIFIETQEDLFFEYILNWSNRKICEQRIIQQLRSKFRVKAEIQDVAIRTKILNSIRSLMGSIDDPILGLSTIGVSQKSSRSGYQLDRIFTDQHAFKINGTIILVYHKQHESDGIKPENLFSVFAEAVVSNPQNYLSILSLELKDRLRESFSSIGNQFAMTDERAFFYHLENYRTLHENKYYDLRYINDVILKCWIGELHQQQINEQPSILQFADHRYKELIAPPPKSLSEADSLLINELVKYSAYISTTKLERRSDSTLRFGDLFYNSSKPDEFFLCVTPSCDCMHPENINNNFYFVKGSVSNSLKSIKAAESGFHSFVVQNDKPKCIEWQCKPFTSYITKNDIYEILLDYCGAQIVLKHLTVLKENFTQRIANESFGYGFRVGIDLPH